MRRKTLSIDAGMAVMPAVLVLSISPGVAIARRLAILALTACVASFGPGSRAHTRRASRTRRVR